MDVLVHESCLSIKKVFGNLHTNRRIFWVVYNRPESQPWAKCIRDCLCMTNVLKVLAVKKFFKTSNNLQTSYVRYQNGFSDSILYDISGDTCHV